MLSQHCGDHFQAPVAEVFAANGETLPEAFWQKAKQRSDKAIPWKPNLNLFKGVGSVETIRAAPNRLSLVRGKIESDPRREASYLP